MRVNSEKKAWLGGAALLFIFLCCWLSHPRERKNLIALCLRSEIGGAARFFLSVRLFSGLFNNALLFSLGALLFCSVQIFGMAGKRLLL
jgi:hypothetical protein